MPSGNSLSVCITASHAIKMQSKHLGVPRLYRACEIANPSSPNLGIPPHEVQALNGRKHTHSHHLRPHMKDMQSVAQDIVVLSCSRFCTCALSISRSDSVSNQEYSTHRILGCNHSSLGHFCVRHWQPCGTAVGRFMSIPSDVSTEEHAQHGHGNDTSHSERLSACPRMFEVKSMR